MTTKSLLTLSRVSAGISNTFRQITSSHCHISSHNLVKVPFSRSGQFSLQWIQIEEYHHQDQWQHLHPGRLTLEKSLALQVEFLLHKIRRRNKYLQKFGDFYKWCFPCGIYKRTKTERNFPTFARNEVRMRYNNVRRFIGQKFRQI